MAVPDPSPVMVETAGAWRGSPSLTVTSAT